MIEISPGALPAWNNYNYFVYLYTTWSYISSQPFRTFTENFDNWSEEQGVHFYQANRIFERTKPGLSGCEYDTWILTEQSVY